MKYNMELPKVSMPKFLKSVKYTLAGINGIFLITGILLLVVGIVVLVTYSNFDGLITNKFFTLPSFVIATGVIILVTSVLGFYSAISEQFYFIAGYVIMLLVVLVFEISMIIVAYGLEGNSAAEIQSTMLDSLRQYGTRIEVARMWDDLHRGFECCGARGRFDFNSDQIPVSCCHIDYGVVASFTCTVTNAHTQGCAGALGDVLNYYALVVAVSAVVATSLQVPLTALGAWIAYRAKFQEVELES